MGIADELADLMHKRASSLSVRDAATIRRAVEALRAGEKTAAILAAVREDFSLRECSRCQYMHARHHRCYRCGHDPSERPSAAEEKP